VARFQNTSKSVLISRSCYKAVTEHLRQRLEVRDSPDGEEVWLENSFRQGIRYITSTKLCSARLENSFGDLQVYFNNAVLQNHAADVRAECSFGIMTLYIPASWKVVTTAHCAVGGVEEKGSCNPQGEETLEIRCDVSFGCITIIYV